MKIDPQRIPCFVFLLVVAWALAFVPRGAHAARIDEISYGRFAGWPTGRDANDCTRFETYYEEDLIKRVYSDYLTRDNRDITTMPWRLYFGWADGSTDFSTIAEDHETSETATVVTKEASWIHKKWEVRRKADGIPLIGGTTDGNTYRIRVGSASLGTWLTSSYPRFYLHHDAAPMSTSTHTTFSRIAIPVRQDTLDTVEIHDLSWLASGWGPPAGSVAANENWVLLWGSHGGTGPIVPVMVTYSSDLVAIQANVGDDFIQFWFSGTGEHRVALSYPYGVMAFNGDEDTWFGSMNLYDLPAATNRLVSNAPSTIEETFTRNDSMVTITDVFSFERFDPQTPPFNYASLPPLVQNARHQLGSELITVPAELVGATPTKYGLLLYLEDANSISYSIPAGPPYDIHFARASQTTVDQQKADRMVNTLCSQLRKTRLDVFSSMNNYGAPAVLSMVAPQTRERYVNRMRDLVIDSFADRSTPSTDIDMYYEEEPISSGEGTTGLLNGPPGNSCKENWQGFKSFDLEVVPGTTLRFTAATWRRVDGIQDYPYDIDAGAGTILQFLYEYILWGGQDAKGIVKNLYGSSSDVTLSIKGLYAGLESFHDWAYLASSHDFWGGTGSIMDMFAAQYAGYHAFAEMTKIFGDVGESELARCLEAKAQLPLMLRWTFLDDYASGFMTHEPPYYNGTSLISGFGEGEVTGPLGPSYFFSVEDWNDWALSGERIQPLIVEPCVKLLDLNAGANGPFHGVLDLFHQQLPPRLAQGVPILTFPSAKIWAFRRAGWYQDRNTALADIAAVTSNQIPGTDTWLNPSPVYPQWTRPAGVSSWDAWKSVGMDPHDAPALEEMKADKIPEPIYAGILESIASPLYVGSWGEIQPVAIEYNPSSGILHVDATNAGTMVIQCDAVVSRPGNAIEWYPRWNAFSVNVSAGPNDIPVDAGGFLDQDALVTADSNVAYREDFEDMGAGRANMEKGWTGSDFWGSGAFHEEGVSVRSDPLTPGNRALHEELGDGQEQSWALSYARVGEGGTPYRLRFRYRLPNPDSRFTVYLSTPNDAHCYRDNSNGIPKCSVRDTLKDKTGGIALVNAMHYAALDTAGAEQVYQDPVEVDDWTWFEARGIARDPDPTRADVLGMQPTLRSAGTGWSGLREVWLDDVEVAIGDSVGYSRLYQPTEGEVFEQDEDIPFAWYPDGRVEGFENADNSLVPTPDSLRVALRWVRVSAVGDTVSTAIPGSQLPGHYGGAPLKAGRFVWRPSNLSYYGTLWLEIDYYENLGGAVHLAATLRSDKFLIAPPPPVFETTSLDQLGLDNLAGKQIYTSLTPQLGGTQYLLTSVMGAGEWVQVYKNIASFSAQWPVFAQVQNAFNQASAASDARGMTIWDYDGDGADDLFVAAPADSARLYRYESDSANPVFADQSDRLPSSARPRVWAAGFGNYLSNDGYADLYLARAGATSELSPVAFDSLGESDVLLQFDREDSSFIDVTAQAFSTMPAVPTTSVSWCDVTGNGLGDLYVGYAGIYHGGEDQGWSPLYIQISGGQFYDASIEGTRTLLDPMAMPVEGTLANGSSSPQVPRIAAVTASQFADIDGDGNMDLIVTRHHDPQPDPEWNVLILLNGGNGDFTQRFTRGLEGLEPAESVALGDLDGEPPLDMVVVPVDDTAPLRFFLGYTFQGGTQYVDRSSSSLQVPSRGAHSVSLVDFNPQATGGSLQDLFLGQMVSSSADTGMVYMNRGNGTGSGKLVRVELSAVDSGNLPGGLGAKVSAVAQRDGVTVTQARRIAADGGREGQGSPWPVFGVEDGGQATLTVTWPDGYVQTRTVSGDSTVVTFADDHLPQVENATVTSQYEPGPGTADWIFSWETDFSSSWDEVEVWDSKKSPGSCLVGEIPDPDDPTKSLVLLTAARGDVTVTVERIKGGTGRFLHTLRWSAVPCSAPCSYTYRVNSYSDTRRSSSPVQTFKIFVCSQIGE